MIFAFVARVLVSTRRRHTNRDLVAGVQTCALPILLASLAELHPATTALALLSLALAIYGPRIPGLARVPGPLLAMVVATLIQAVVGFGGVATIASTFCGIPQGLPGITFHTDRPGGGQGKDGSIQLTTGGCLY